MSDSDQVIFIKTPSRPRRAAFIGSALLGVALVVVFWSFLMKGFIVDASDRLRTGDGAPQSSLDEFKALWDRQINEWDDAWASLRSPPDAAALQAATAAVRDEIMNAPGQTAATSDNQLPLEP